MEVGGVHCKVQDIEVKECLECGDEINPRRVKANPRAALCIGCQQELENNGGYPLHVMDVQAKSKCGDVDETVSTIVRSPRA